MNAGIDTVGIAGGADLDRIGGVGMAGSILLDAGIDRVGMVGEADLYRVG